ncbi:MAG: murein biosynthesis integral membrane protein MurJ [Clostridia bacterium]|nr:murein biosynthesis integral membrane protein MurJ [Clostridia bacterium]
MGNKVARAAVIVLIMNLISRLLGFARDVVIAKEFGAGGATDAFMVAYTIPYFLQSILGMAFVMVIVPILTKYALEGRTHEVWRASSIVLNWTLAILVLVTLLGMLVSGGLVGLMAPGFSQELTELARQLTFIMFPSIIFMGLGMLVTGILNAHHVFGTPAFAPAAENIILIAIIIIFGSRLGVHAMAVGTLLGFIFFLLIQIPSMRKLGFSYELSFDVGHPALKKTAASIIPIIFGVGVNQIYLALNRFFASMVAVGSITAIDFAYRLINLPIGIFAAAVSTVVFPTMSQQAVSRDEVGLCDTLTRGLNMVALITIPSAVGLMVLNIPVVELLFQRGAFDGRATAMTGTALVYFSWGILGWGANMVLVRAYYAVNDIRTPVTTGIVSVIVNILLSYLFLSRLGHGGLALANSLAVLTHCLLLFLFLSRRLPHLKFTSLAMPLFKVILASVFMGAAVYYVNQILTVPLFLEVLISVLTGVVVYILMALLLGIKEINQIKNLVPKRMQTP